MLEAYGKRLRALEDLVTSLVDEQQRLAAQLALQKQDTASGVSRNAASTLRENHNAVAAPFPQDVPLPPSEPIVAQEQFTPITRLVPSDTTDTIDPELVSSSADESHAVPLDLPNPSVGSILQTAHADKNENATAPMVYSDDYGTLAADGTDGAKYVYSPILPTETPRQLTNIDMSGWAQQSGCRMIAQASELACDKSSSRKDNNRRNRS